MKEIFGFGSKGGSSKRERNRRKTNTVRKTVRNTDFEEDDFYDDMYDAESAVDTYDHDIMNSYDLEEYEDSYDYDDDTYEEEDSEEDYEQAYEESDYEELYESDEYEDSYETDTYEEEYEEATYEDEYEESYELAEEDEYEDSYELEDDDYEDSYEEAEYEEECEESYEGDYDELFEESAYEDGDEALYEDADDEEEDDLYEDTQDAYVENLGLLSDDYASDDMDFYEDDDDFYGEDVEEDDYYEDDEFYMEADDSLDGVKYGEYDEYEEDDEEYVPPVVYGDERFDEGDPWFAILAGKIVQFTRKMSTIDMILVATAIVIVVFGGVTLASYAVSKNIHKQVEALAPVGEELSNMGIVGESGLLALADNALAADNAETVEEFEEETTEEAEESADDVKVSFTSVERDLKIKFIYGSTGNLVTGVNFEVELRGPKGKTTTLTDDDKDGIIYQKDLTAGNYDVVIKSVGEFNFPDEAQKVTVKDKIEYVAINVQNEIKKESQVNVAVEDTAQVNAAAEAESTPAVKDTVEWVESSKTAKDDSAEYSKISKDSITDPSTTSRRQSMMKLDTIDASLDKSEETVTVGNTVTLKGKTYQDSSSDTEKITYSYEWSSSDESVATVSGGTVTGKKAGTATITYKVVKKTVKTDNKEEEKTEEISVEEYEKLSSEEKKNCVEIKKDVEETIETEEQTTDEDGNEVTHTVSQKVTTEKVVGYKYTYKESSSSSSETTEEGKATCKVTVKEEEVYVTAATLSLDKSDVSVAEKATVTIAPSKMEYKYTNGKTESKTSGFPTISWSTSDKSIATVDDKGGVTGVKAGSATITASAAGIKDKSGKELSVTATCKVTVTASKTLTVTLDQEKASVAVGKKITLKPTVQNYASDSGVTWTSSDEKIAKVDDKGVVTGVKVGSVTITATTKEKSTANNEKVKATCTVTVTSDAMNDKKTLLKDNNGNQVYIKDSKGNYVEAVYADYYTAEKFYIKNKVEYKYTGWQTIDNNTYYFDKNGNYVTGKQIIQGVEYNFTSDGILKMNNSGSTLGIDVSKWNGTINWTAVKNSGVDFAIIRCGYRGSSTGALIEDPTFKKNIQGAKAAGIKVGVYFFTQAVNEVEAVEEASMAISLAKNYGLTYPIFIDTEGSGGRADGISKETRTAAVNAFCRTVSNAGYKAGIYASKSWYEKKLNTGSLSSYKIWLAQYASKPTYGGRYDMWQYTSKGSVGGISGKVDMNISYLGY